MVSTILGGEGIHVLGVLVSLKKYKDTVLTPAGMSDEYLPQLMLCF